MHAAQSVYEFPIISKGQIYDALLYPHDYGKHHLKNNRKKKEGKNKDFHRTNKQRARCMR